MLRAFCQTCTATHTRRCWVAALHGRHRDSIIRHCTLLVAVQNVIVIYISEDISYHYAGMGCTGNSLYSRYAPYRPAREYPALSFLHADIGKQRQA